MTETDYITRSEYETRHSELRTEMIGLRASDDMLRRDVIARFDMFDTKMESLKSKIDASQVGGWRLVAMSLINLVAGVVMGYLAHLLPFTK